MGSTQPHHREWLLSTLEQHQISAQLTKNPIILSCQTNRPFLENSIREERDWPNYRRNFAVKGKQEVFRDKNSSIFSLYLSCLNRFSVKLNGILSFRTNLNYCWIEITLNTSHKESIGCPVKCPSHTPGLRLIFDLHYALSFRLYDSNCRRYHRYER